MGKETNDVNDKVKEKVETKQVGTAAKEGVDGLDEQTKSYKDQVKDRKDGVRDRHTKKILGDQPKLGDPSIEKIVDLFEKAKKKEDLSSVIAEVAKKQEELVPKGQKTSDDYKLYIKELNKRLHEEKLLPEGINLDDGSKVDRLKNLESLYGEAVLPVVTSDGRQVDVWNAKGQDRMNEAKGSDRIDGVFDSRRENRKEKNATAQEAAANVGERYFDFIDKYNPNSSKFDDKGDGRITKQELDEYINAFKRDISADDLKGLETIRDNFGKIKRSSNDDVAGVFGREKGISKKDLIAYEDQYRKELGLGEKDRKPVDLQQNAVDEVSGHIDQATAAKSVKSVVEDINAARKDESIDFDKYIKSVDQKLHDAGILAPTVHLDADAYKKGDVKGLAVELIDQNGKSVKQTVLDEQGKDTKSVKGIPDLFQQNSGKGDAIDQRAVSNGAVANAKEVDIVVAKGEKLDDVAVAAIQRRYGRDYQPIPIEIALEVEKIARVNNIPDSDWHKPFAKETEITVPLTIAEPAPKPLRPETQKGKEKSQNDGAVKPVAAGSKPAKGILDPFED